MKRKTETQRRVERIRATNEDMDMAVLCTAGSPWLMVKRTAENLPPLDFSEEARKTFYAAWARKRAKLLFPASG